MNNKIKDSMYPEYQTDLETLISKQEDLRNQIDFAEYGIEVSGGNVDFATSKKLEELHKQYDEICQSIENLKKSNSYKPYRDSKANMIGKKLKDSVVVDYDDNGIIAKDKNGIEKYIKDDEGEEVIANKTNLVIDLSAVPENSISYFYIEKIDSFKFDEAKFKKNMCEDTNFEIVLQGELSGLDSEQIIMNLEEIDKISKAFNVQDFDIELLDIDIKLKFNGTFKMDNWLDVEVKKCTNGSILNYVLAYNNKILSGEEASGINVQFENLDHLLDSLETDCRVAEFVEETLKTMIVGENLYEENAEITIDFRNAPEDCKLFEYSEFEKYGPTTKLKIVGMPLEQLVKDTDQLYLIKRAYIDYEERIPQYPLYMNLDVSFECHFEEDEEATGGTPDHVTYTMYENVVIDRYKINTIEIGCDATDVSVSSFGPKITFKIKNLELVLSDIIDWQEEEKIIDKIKESYF